MTKEEILEVIKNIELERPLSCEYGSDARYTWPDRWEILKERLEKAPAIPQQAKVEICPYCHRELIVLMDRQTSTIG